jgi:hypothetical protein
MLSSTETEEAKYALPVAERADPNIVRSNEEQPANNPLFETEKIPPSLTAPAIELLEASVDPPATDSSDSKQAVPETLSEGPMTTDPRVENPDPTRFCPLALRSEPKMVAQDTDND